MNLHLGKYLYVVAFSRVCWWSVWCVIQLQINDVYTACREVNGVPVEGNEVQRKASQQPKQTDSNTRVLLHSIDLEAFPTPG